MFDYELYLWKIGEPVETATRITYNSGNDRWPDIWFGKLPESKAPADAQAVANAAETATATAAQVQAVGGVSEAKMDELIKAIDRLTEAVKALAPSK
jgi:hypothetical protein